MLRFDAIRNGGKKCSDIYIASFTRTLNLQPCATLERCTRIQDLNSILATTLVLHFWNHFWLASEGTLGFALNSPEGAVVSRLDLFISSLNGYLFATCKFRENIENKTKSRLV
jgi:hypothetical protein